MADNVEILMSIIGVELRKAQAIHKSMRSSHEGYAVIKEELDELWSCQTSTSPSRCRGGRSGACLTLRPS